MCVHVRVHTCACAISCFLVSFLFDNSASGKSVFLKQVGLIVYLAHIGCFVPAGAVASAGFQYNAGAVVVGVLRFRLTTTLAPFFAVDAVCRACPTTGTDKVEMGMFSGIMTRIQSSESVSSRNSSFGSDLTQIHFMMRNAKADSLLLIDEFGVSLL
jgi:DNA mismatch repair protein MSH5